MREEKIQLTTEFITLSQLLKFAGLVANGGEAKHVIVEGMVKVNGEVELRRGKKIRSGEIVEFADVKLIVE